jgi:hypothetical protein
LASDRPVLWQHIGANPQRRETFISATNFALAKPRVIGYRFSEQEFQERRKPWPMTGS